MALRLLILGLTSLASAGGLFYWLKEREGVQYFLPTMMMMALVVMGILSISAISLF